MYLFDLSMRLWKVIHSSFHFPDLISRLGEELLMLAGGGLKCDLVLGCTPGCGGGECSALSHSMRGCFGCSPNLDILHSDG